MTLLQSGSVLSPTTIIEYHADDFGLFPAQSMRILDCHYKGNLNGISILPNSEDLAVCMELLQPVRKEIAVTVHLNLIEGCCLSKPSEELGLTDLNGIFRITFGNLLLRSYLPDRKKYRQWLKEELRAQIRAVAAFLPEGTPLRLDGHAHYHMIPVVFDALMEVIREDALNVSYIRIPREYPTLYLRHLGQLRDFAPINLAKVLILNLLARRNQRKHADAMVSMEKKVFLGVFLSGRMYRENVAPILPDAIALAKKLGQGLEILAHPGGVYESDDIAKLTCEEDVAFLTSDLRRREASLFQA